MTDLESDPTVTRNDEDGRYEVRIDDVLAGFTEIRTDEDGRLEFPHTEIDPAFEGRGLSKVLVGQALTDAASRGETVVPLCSVVARYLTRNEVPGLTVVWPRGARPE
jgi:predicted GNAT family acetyltransferase